MVIFPIIIVLSFVLYIYYKVAIIRTNEPLFQHYYQSKSKICLGIFVFFFGINQYLFYETRLSLFIGILFLVIGGLQAWDGIKRTRFYREQAQSLEAYEE
ncbi:YtpI family protein [Radiobacillus kanasensis]|uniref:YtpI family protein n=1 Tax=Radiobacillus kanasensis TaxID=2844358 RepID=UPI001E3D6D0D|nr:YtpI family protein [Radiobacillus kanasensis]UFT98022.1 YtpI family protein [Radiobacillus kanasensis]